MEDRIIKLTQRASEVIRQSPQDTRQVQSVLKDVSQSWESLKTKSANRKLQLDNAQLMHTFMTDSREMVRNIIANIYVLFCNFYFYFICRLLGPLRYLSSYAQRSYHRMLRMLKKSWRDTER